MKFRTYEDFYRHTIIGMWIWAILSFILFFITSYAPVVIFPTIIFLGFVIIDYINYRLNKED